MLLICFGPEHTPRPAALAGRQHRVNCLKYVSNTMLAAFVLMKASFGKYMRRRRVLVGAAVRALRLTRLPGAAVAQVALQAGVEEAEVRALKAGVEATTLGQVRPSPCHIRQL